MSKGDAICVSMLSLASLSLPGCANKAAEVTEKEHQVVATAINLSHTMDDLQKETDKIIELSQQGKEKEAFEVYQHYAAKGDSLLTALHDQCLEVEKGEGKK